MRKTDDLEGQSVDRYSQPSSKIGKPLVMFSLFILLTENLRTEPLLRSCRTAVNLRLYGRLNT
jgi:hypothetical protein